MLSGSRRYQHYAFHKHHNLAKAESKLLKLCDYPPTSHEQDDPDANSLLPELLH